MDWLLLVFIMAFIFWSFQMIIVYRRQMERRDEQVRQVRAIAEEMPEQIIKYGFIMQINNQNWNVSSLRPKIWTKKRKK